MKKRMLLSGLLAGALIMAMAACTQTEAEPSATPTAESTATLTATPTAEPTATPVLSQRAVWGTQGFERTFISGDGVTVMTVSYTLPLVQNTDDCTAGTAINDWYKSLGSSLLISAEDNYESAVSDYEVSKAAGYTFVPTTETITYDISRANDSYYSISRTWTISGGMPYVSIFRLAEQFDAQTGEKLDFEDFFTDADAVKERVVAAFLTQDEIISGQYTQEQIEGVYQQANFRLTDEGYVFWIQGNDLTAIHSPVEVTLSYDELKDVSVYDG